jgi:hypothetical protein
MPVELAALLGGEGFRGSPDAEKKLALFLSKYLKSAEYPAFANLLDKEVFPKWHQGWDASSFFHNLCSENSLTVACLRERQKAGTLQLEKMAGVRSKARSAEKFNNQNRAFAITEKEYSVGEKINLDGAPALKILKYIGEGENGMVYQAQDAKGKPHALKISKNQNAFGMEKFRRETQERMPALKQLGLRHAKIEASGPHFILKEWVEGISGEAWANQWMRAGAPEDYPGYKELYQLFSRAAHQGAFVNDLKPANLIWTGKEWVIIDASDVERGISVKRALLNFKHTIQHDWANADGGVADCALIFMKLKPKKR